jgi:hypothetical protein
MTEARTTTTRSKLVTGSRWALAILAALFTLGAFGQFFLVGLSFFDDAARWKDHAELGHIIGLLPWLMWIPAVIGKTGPRLIGASILLFLLFEAQYALINVDNTVANAFHPLNGSVLLVLGFWITQRAVASLRQPAGNLLTHATPVDRSARARTLEGTMS